MRQSWVRCFVLSAVLASCGVQAPMAQVVPTNAPPAPTASATVRASVASANNQPASATPTGQPSGVLAAPAPPGQASGTAAAAAGTPVRSFASAPPMQIDVNRNYTATLDTTKGVIVVALLPKVAPLTVNNFVFLARQHFYDGLKFHRVEPNFVIQGGDPQGSGMGGPGYRFPDEPVKQMYKAGTVAMANAGPNTNGSQFFICIVDLPELPPQYTIFGQTTSGMDVVKSVKVGDMINKVTVAE